MTGRHQSPAFHRYASRQTDTQTDKQTDHNTSFPYQGRVTKLKPDLGAFYDIRPGNKLGLFDRSLGA